MAFPQEKFFVLPTVEVRWFFKGLVPPDINKWFSEQGYKPESQLSRVDYYLCITDSDSLGIKLREGRMEIKQRHEKSSVVQLGEHAEGCMEHWHKCGFELAKVMVEKSGEEWWSLGFEAFGNNTDLSNSLLLASKKILSTKGAPVLKTENSYGYPRLLHNIDKEKI